MTPIILRYIVPFRGSDYDITRVDTFKGYKQNLTLYAKRKAGQQIAKN